MVNVTAEIETEVTLKRVTLDLDAEEAWFLVDVLSCIGGHPTQSRRKYENRISRALQNAGISLTDSPHGTDDIMPSNRTLMFKVT